MILKKAKARTKKCGLFCGEKIRGYFLKLIVNVIFESFSVISSL